MSNDLMTVNYETALGAVQLDAETVKQYLVKGNGNVSDQEVFLFVKMCQAQRLNPFVTGEVYLIKFGSQPAQMVVGYDTYKRRADENPAHLYTESGIVVCRGTSGEIVQKTGACLYPTEQLVGGWCRVHMMNRIILMPKYITGRSKICTNEGGSAVGRQRKDMLGCIERMKNKWGKYYKFDEKHNKSSLNVQR